MTAQRSAVIIGAGIGGITTAAYLARNNYVVDVYEKNSTPGGRCGQLNNNGYRFDLGATMLLMPGIYHDIFRSLGIDLEEGREIVPLEDLYRIYFDDGKELAFTRNPEKMQMQLENIEPGSYLRSQEYVSSGYEIFRLGMKKLIGRNFYNLFQFANPANIGLLVKMKTYMSNWAYAKRFFKHPHLLMAYTFQNIYVGQSPFSSPALFSMIPAAELTEGSFFPRGGMFSIVNKLFDAAGSYGVRFHFNREVKKIDIDGRKVRGVILTDGSIAGADVVIANADLPYVYRELLPDKRKSAHLDRLKYSCSAICFHWGLDKVYSQLGHHSVFLSDGFREGLDRVFIDKTVGSRPSFYVHAPVRTDPSAVPESHDALLVIVGAGHNDRTRNQDWNVIRQQTRAAVIERLEKAGLTDIEDHIKFEAAYTPASWESACNISRGSVFGSLGHNILQMGYFRPHNRHSRYHNLYFTGGSTHPGNGIPNVLISARLVTERILKDERKLK